MRRSRRSTSPPGAEHTSSSSLRPTRDTSCVIHAVLLNPICTYGLFSFGCRYLAHVPLPWRSEISRVAQSADPTRDSEFVGNVNRLLVDPQSVPIWYAPGYNPSELSTSSAPPKECSCAEFFKVKSTYSIIYIVQILMMGMNEVRACLPHARSSLSSTQ